MRHKFQQVLDKIHDFLNGHDQPDQTESNSLTATIEEAVQKQTAVHLILSETSFTGDIIKYDQQRQQIIVKNFAKNVTRIIRISDIQRLRFVPSTGPNSPKNRFKKEVRCSCFIPLFFLANLFKM